jgi:hypothetical protein
MHFLVASLSLSLSHAADTPIPTTTIYFNSYYVNFTDSDPFTSGGITVGRGTAFTITWTAPAQAPHIVQFMVRSAPTHFALD